MNKQTATKQKQAFEERVNRFVRYNNIMRVKTAKAEQEVLNMARNISLAELNTIKTIATNEFCTMSTIAKEVYLTQGSVTQLIDKLIKKKLVKRNRSEDDRRIVYAELTLKGKKIYNSYIEGVKTTARTLFNKISVKEQEAVLGMMQKWIT
jgi:DNA-binding MarR family transcriptional regulator